MGEKGDRPQQIRVCNRRAVNASDGASRTRKRLIVRLDSFLFVGVELDLLARRYYFTFSRRLGPGLTNPLSGHQKRTVTLHGVGERDREL